MAPPILEAAGVWKVFGGKSERLFLGGATPDDATIAAAGGTAGVCDASFAIARGEIFIIMGLSGSGKSTLLRCLTGLYPVTRGIIRIDGTDLAGARPQELVALRRRKISMVFQNFALLPHLNALDNVAFPLRVQNVPLAERHATARKTLELVGLAGKEGFFPGQLSGGQQQRVGIARSLVTDPSVWFLDEPFSALDPLIRREMQDEFLRLQASLQKSIVFVTHDLEEAVRLGNRIAVMQRGRIVQIGTPEDLVMRPVDDYVRAFVAGLPKDRVIRVRSVIEAVDAADPTHPALSADATLSEVSRDVMQCDLPIAVRDGSGAVIGQISRRGLAKWLD